MLMQGLFYHIIISYIPDTDAASASNRAILRNSISLQLGLESSAPYLCSLQGTTIFYSHRAVGKTFLVVLLCCQLSN